MALEFGKIEKLFIQPCKDINCKEKVGERIEALINPESYTFKYKIDFCETQGSGTSAVALKFNKLPPQEFNFDFLFDGTGVVRGASLVEVAVPNPFTASKNVAEQINDFRHKLLEYQGGEHRPNYLLIQWGTLLFKGVLTAMDIEFKLFKPDGTPIRAIARCSFKGTVDEELRVAKENPQSADITHERVFDTSSRLSLVAGKIYNDQQFYVDVAKANGLDGFRNIVAGTKVFFPPIKK
jgi:hypothetical protein